MRNHAQPFTRQLAHGRFAVAMVAMLLSALLVASCKHDNGSPDAQRAVQAAEANRNGPQWIFQDPALKPVAVVFIHGIFGDALDTWTSTSGVRFFDLLHQSELGSQLDIYAFGYTSDMFKGGSLSIDEAARSLHQYFQFHKLLDYDHIVVVAHSMGGLVAMQELTSHIDLAKKVPLMVLYATPQEGSQITAIAQHIVDNDAIRQMLLVDQNDFLRELNNEWAELRGSGNAPRVICAYEKRPTNGVMIVPWSSATRHCDEAPPAIEGSDHLSIVKPTKPDDLAVVVLVNALETYVMPRLDASNWKLSNVTIQGSDWVYELRDVNNFNRATLTNTSALSLRYRIIRPDNSDLYISPEESTRTVAAGGSDEIRMFPLGSLKDEYVFQLGLGSNAARRIRVLIPDMHAALAARSNRSTETVAAVDRFLRSRPDPIAFNSLSAQEKSEALANAAFEFLSATSIDLPDHAKWVLTADTLSRIGMSESALTALRTAERKSPTLAQSAGARDLAAIISAQSGKPKVFESPTTLELAPNDFEIQDNDLIYANEAQRKQWNGLTARLEKISGFEGEAFLIRGDIEVANGDKKEASKLYQQAANVKSTPWLERKLSELQTDGR